MRPGSQPPPTRLQRLGEWGFTAAAGIHAAAVAALRWTHRRGTALVARLPQHGRLAILMGFMLLAAGLLLALGGQRLVTLLGLDEESIQYLKDEGIASGYRGLKLMFACSAALSALGVGAAFLRRRRSLFLMQAATALFSVLWAWMLGYAVRLPVLLQVELEVFDKIARDELWITVVSWWFLAAWVPATALIMLTTRRVGDYYGGRSISDQLGDRLIAWWNRPGQDERFRVAVRWAAFIHIFIVVLPFILRGCGWERPVPIPPGEGAEQIEVVKVKPKKIEKKWFLSKYSPIIFERPDIDESEVMEEVDKITENQYEATAIGKVGAKGAKGGWPNGMPGKIRFIRLKYGGGDWDQDMGRGADHNFLITFKKLTGFDVEDRTEAKAIDRLRRFPKHRGPPFVYLTGKGGIHVGARDVKTLRWYCLEEGGMIWADNGGGHFDSSFRALLRRVFPDKELIDIANDDVIYRQPYGFPSGAPPLWHHSGYRALGIRHNGRWVVFYHQGDMNDAWKDSPDASEAVAMQSFKMGVNIAHYAFTSYLAIHTDAGKRKN